MRGTYLQPNSEGSNGKGNRNTTLRVLGALTLPLVLLLLVTGAGRAKVIGPIAGWAPGDVVVQGDFAYLAAGENGLQIIDISNPSAPQEIASLPTSGNAEAIDVQGNYVYLLDEYTKDELGGVSGFRVIDVSDPVWPREVAFLDTPGKAEEVFVQDQYAYLADGKAGLRIIDISKPSFPSEVGSFPRKLGGQNLMGAAVGVFVTGELAYVTELYAGLHIIDISDPSSCTEVGRASTPGWAFAVYVEGEYAYVLDQEGKETSLRILDISDPSFPQLVASVETPGEAKEVAVRGNYAYIADYFGAGLLILDVSDPRHPVNAEWSDDLCFTFIPEEAWEEELFPSAVSVYLQGDYAYVFDDFDGLYVIDLARSMGK